MSIFSRQHEAAKGGMGQKTSISISQMMEISCFCVSTRDIPDIQIQFAGYPAFLTSGKIQSWPDITTNQPNIWPDIFPIYLPVVHKFMKTFKCNLTQQMEQDLRQ